ncbi:MAG: glycosyltransferase, partial [Terriglobales bacterium]
AALVVVPLRIGGGSRIKILEALAMAKPVLATPIGAEGLGVEADRQLEIAAGAPAFALRAVELLGDGAQRRRLGEEGCAWVRRHHDWEQCARALEAAWWAAVRPEAELRIVAGGRA